MTWTVCKVTSLILKWSIWDIYLWWKIAQETLSREVARQRNYFIDIIYIKKSRLSWPSGSALGCYHGWYGFETRPAVVWHTGMGNGTTELKSSWDNCVQKEITPIAHMYPSMWPPFSLLLLFYSILNADQYFFLVNTNIAGRKRSGGKTSTVW